MKLYYSSGACSLASHILLREAKLDFTIEKVDLKNKTTEKGDNFLNINAKGYVPALELDNKQILTEGTAILQYIADQAPTTKLAPAAGTLERYRLQEWLGFINSEIHKTFSPLFNPATPDTYKNTVKEYLAKRLDFIANYFTQSKKEYLMGDHFTAPDAYLYVVLGWSNFLGFDLSKWPNIKSFIERVGARPAVKEARQAEGLS
ncbi:MAG: glutathione transferase GstA [Alphaproteobacteria bacterium]|nr:glutathione transferase GstA [Alphaproteobacteria bacterium]